MQEYIDLKPREFNYSVARKHCVDNKGIYLQKYDEGSLFDSLYGGGSDWDSDNDSNDGNSDYGDFSDPSDDEGA